MNFQVYGYTLGFWGFGVLGFWGTICVFVQVTF